MTNINNEFDIVDVFIRDADKYGLVSEVVLFALKYIKNNPDKTIEDAINYGYDEWIKQRLTNADSCCILVAQRRKHETICCEILLA